MICWISGSDSAKDSFPVQINLRNAILEGFFVNAVKRNKTMIGEKIDSASVTNSGLAIFRGDKMHFRSYFTN